MWNKATFFVLLPFFEIGVMLVERYALDSSKHVSPPLTQKASMECKEDSNSLTSAVCMQNTASIGPLVKGESHIIRRPFGNFSVVGISKDEAN